MVVMIDGDGGDDDTFYHFMHCWIQVEALGKGKIALGKAFAECGTRQRTLGKKLVGKDLFAECLLSGTRQRLCRVFRGHLAKKSDYHGAGPIDGQQRIFYFF